jgi:dienelactone hydrolase
VSRRIPLAALAMLASVALATNLVGAAPPPALPRPVTLVGADGLTTLEVHPAAATSSSLPGADRPVVVVVPGWNCTASLFTDVTQYLTNRGYAVAVYSHADNLDGASADWNVWVEGALDLLEAETASPLSPLFHEVDTSRLALLGHSLGGATATLVASYDPRVKALVVFAPQSGDLTFLAAATLVRAPLLAIDGSLDRIAPHDTCGGVVISNAASTDKGTIVITGGNHPNCPADFDTDYIRDPGQWVLKSLPTFPFFTWAWDWPVVPGIKPIPGPQQRATAFPYLGAWLDRYVSGLKDPDHWTDGKQADAQVGTGVLTEDYFSPSARKGT